jgi:CheY-like chemotaxis protein
MPLRILVSDDEPDIRDFIGHVLQRAGHDVTVVGDGAEALAHASEAAFDLLILDNHMPGMTGLEVAGQLRDLRPDTKVLLMSGDLDIGDQHPHFLPKPFNRTELAAAIDDLLDGPAT